VTLLMWRSCQPPEEHFTEITPPLFIHEKFSINLNCRSNIISLYVRVIIMPSRGNPNVPNKSRRIASRAKVQKRNSINKISKNPRGTARSTVLHPTSGPLAPPSSKKARKIEKAKNHARQRAIQKAMEQGGEVTMTGM
jgi:hypothetical protein